MEKQQIRSIRKGSVQWNEEDRLQVGMLLLKAGYAVQIGRQAVPDREGKKTTMEYVINYWEEKDEPK